MSANVNKYIAIGRLTRDPEFRSFDGGGGVVNFGLAVNNRVKRGDKWEEEPMFIDCKMFNRGESKRADVVYDHFRKGDPIYIEGHLVLEQWKDKNTGDNRSKHVVVVDEFQFIQSKADADKRDGGGAGRDDRSRDDRGRDDRDRGRDDRDRGRGRDDRSRSDDRDRERGRDDRSRSDDRDRERGRDDRGDRGRDDRDRGRDAPKDDRDNRRDAHRSDRPAASGPAPSTETPDDEIPF